MKKILLTICLFVFSLYYTYICSEILIRNNPIYLKIVKNSHKYEKNPTNAKITFNEIEPGKSGKKVSKMESFNNMNKYGKYDDSLYVFHEEKPKVNIDSYYDKYITIGNKDIKSVSLIFTVSDSIGVEDILKVLKEKSVHATFFIDGRLMETDNNLINKLIYSGNEIELLNYDGLFDENKFKNSLDYLSLIKNDENLYCYTPFKRDKVLEICKKNKLHTVVPTIVINRDMLYIVKENLKNGLIIKMPNTDKTLSVTIDYIKSRNYKIVKLETLLHE